MDVVFDFSMPLGREYRGEWVDASTFTVTVVAMPPFPLARDAFLTHLGGRPAEFARLDVSPPDGAVSEGEWREGYANVTVALLAELRDATSRSRVSRGMAPHTPDEARLRSRFPLYEPVVPEIVNVTAEDPDNGDDVFGAGDVLRVHFAQATNRGANSGGKAFVDRLLAFEPPIGASYSGAWRDDMTFVVRALDCVGGELRICDHAGCAPEARSNVTLVGRLRNRGGTSPAADSMRHLAGVSDAGAPRVESFVVSDPDDADYVFSDGDRVTVQLDRMSDLGAYEARWPRVDALFDFNIPLGADYLGEWADDSVFAITIVKTRYELPLINQTTVTPRLPIRDARQDVCRI